MILPQPPLSVVNPKRPGRRVERAGLQPMKPIAPAPLDPQYRAKLIYMQARSELSSRLWQAALGTGDNEMSASRAKPQMMGDARLETLLATLSEDIGRPMAASTMPPPEMLPSHPRDGDASADRPLPEPAPRSDKGTEATGLGANAHYGARLEAASARTGIPAPALAAIVNAEAAKGPDGRWLAYSRNPRSSAAGLGQFLSSTWVGEAERKGSWLNDTAQARGWIDAKGRVRSGARSELLALRYNGDASIEATADYARANLNALERAGARIGNDADHIARTAYLGHHLGVGDAARFLNGGLEQGRARTLLNAQIGSPQASRRIADSGNATAAHREWLLSYIDKNVRASPYVVRRG